MKRVPKSAVRSSLAGVITKAAAEVQPRLYVVVFPASGMIRRMFGSLLFVEIGGESRWTPMIVNDVATALDPRVLMYHWDTLTVAYQPREHLHEVHEMVGKWYRDNPNTFVPTIGNGTEMLGEMT